MAGRSGLRRLTYGVERALHVLAWRCRVLFGVIRTVDAPLRSGRGVEGRPVRWSCQADLTILGLGRPSPILVRLLSRVLPRMAPHTTWHTRGLSRPPGC